MIEYLRYPRAAAHCRQLRASSRRRCGPHRPDRQAVPAGNGAGDQSGSARCSPVSGSWRLPSLDAGDAAVVVRRPGPRRTAGFRPWREPVGAVAEICRQLDGLPLAIELAAAQIRAMSSLDLARRLDGLRLLRGGARGALPRQQSVAATIDWSYRLLAEPEQALFMRLSVFAGGFDLEAAHGVCGDDLALEDDTLDALTGLVDKSMVFGAKRCRPNAVLRVGNIARLRSGTARRAEPLPQWGQPPGHMRRSFTELAERAAAGMHSEGTSRRGSSGSCPTTTTCARRSSTTTATSDVDSALRLVTYLPEFVHLRIGFEASGWAERTLSRARSRAHVCTQPPWASRRGGRGTVATTPGPGHSRRRRTGGGPAVATAASPIRGTCSPMWRSTRATRQPHFRHYVGEMERARRDEDPIRLVWTFVLCGDLPGRAAHAGGRARRGSAGSGAVGRRPPRNPTARSMARYALGLVLKKSVSRHSAGPVRRRC